MKVQKLPHPRFTKSHVICLLLTYSQQGNCVSENEFRKECTVFGFACTEVLKEF
jgi:hypothetical protein